MLGRHFWRQATDSEVGAREIERSILPPPPPPETLVGSPPGRHWRGRGNDGCCWRASCNLQKNPPNQICLQRWLYVRAVVILYSSFIWFKTFLHFTDFYLPSFLYMQITSLPAPKFASFSLFCSSNLSFQIPWRSSIPFRANKCIRRRRRRRSSSSLKSGNNSMSSKRFSLP